MALRWAQVVLGCFVGCILMVVTFGCSLPPPGFEPPTLTERVYHTQTVFHGQIMEKWTDPHLSSGGEHDAFTASTKVFCIYKGRRLEPLVNVSSLGSVGGRCHNVEVEVGQEYIIFGFSFDGVNMYHSDIESVPASEDNVNLATAACELQVQFPQGKNVSNAERFCPRTSGIDTCTPDKHPQRVHAPPSNQQGPSYDHDDHDHDHDDHDHDHDDHDHDHDDHDHDHDDHDHDHDDHDHDHDDHDHDHDDHDHDHDHDDHDHDHEHYHVDKEHHEDRDFDGDHDHDDHDHPINGGGHDSHDHDHDGDHDHDDHHVAHHDDHDHHDHDHDHDHDDDEKDFTTKNPETDAVRGNACTVAAATWLLGCLCLTARVL